MTTICECGDHAFTTIAKRWVVLVSPQDRDKLVRLFPSYYPCGYISILQKSAANPGKSQSFGRLLIGVGAGFVADHINRNTFDNRRENLRAATVSQNAANSKQRLRKESLPQGVTRCGKGFSARLRVHPEPQKRLGTFPTVDQAAEAYQTARAAAFGEFAPHAPSSHTASPFSGVSA